MRKKASSRKPKKSGGCLKFFLFIFIAVAVFGTFSGSGDNKDSSTKETKPSINAEEPANSMATTNSNEGVLTEIKETNEEFVPDQFYVYFIDVGQGDASLILCDGHSMLIDGGRANQSDKIYTVLKEKGITHLDYIIATHPDDDHVGGLAGALNYATVGVALSPVTSDDSKSFEDFKKYLDKQDTDITIPTVGEKFSLGDSTIEVLGPTEIVDSDNNNSIVLKVIHGDNSLLFPGDAESKEENDIINSDANLKSSVLKIGHHGSSYSTSEEWLNTVNPAVAIISCGAENEYGHPTEELLERLKTRGIQVFRTDLQGDITIHEQDGKLVCEAEKNPDADVFAAGVIPAEDFSEIPLQELEQTKDDETAGNETVTRGGSVQNEPEKHEMDYIVNVNTGKFHYPDCRGVKQMKESNKRYVTCDRQELLNQGYESCGMCRP